MKIKLLIDLPIAGEHGMKQGRVLDVLDNDAGYPRYRPGRRIGFAWVMGDMGEEVKVWGPEFSIVEDGK